MDKTELVYPTNPDYDPEKAPATIEEKRAQADLLEKAARARAKERAGKCGLNFRIKPRR